MDNGMSVEERKRVADVIMDLFADTYCIYIHTQSAHWNLISPQFYALHILLQKQYEELAESIDAIAERVRSLGLHVDASFSSLKRRSHLKNRAFEEKKQDFSLIEDLVLDHEHMAKRYRSKIGFCQQNQDEMSGDLIIKQLTFHEMAAYLLRSHLIK